MFLKTRPWIRCHVPQPHETLAMQRDAHKALRDLQRHLRKVKYLKGNTYITDYLTMVFNNTAQNSISAMGSGLVHATTAGSFYLSLHTADPGNAGSQLTNEAAYTGYSGTGRIAVARSSAGFTVSGQSVTLTAAATFGACSGGSTETETHWGCGTAATSTGYMLYSGPIGSNQGEFATAIGVTANTLYIPAVSGVSVGQQMSFYALPGGALPTGITQGTLYFVKTISGTAVTLSATSGGATLSITGDGSGVAFLHTPIVVTAAPAVTPQLTTGTTITER
jgi:hypothetical protein